MESAGSLGTSKGLLEGILLFITMPSVLRDLRGTAVVLCRFHAPLGLVPEVSTPSFGHLAWVSAPRNLHWR